MRRWLTAGLPVLFLALPSLAQQCPKLCQQHIDALQASVQQLQTTVAQLQQQDPIFTNWPFGSKKALPFQDVNSRDQTSDPFKLPYVPHFALVSFISVRERGSGAADEDIHTSVLLVPPGRAVDFPVSDTNCPGMKISLSGKSLRLQHDCLSRMYGGYPAFNIEFLP